jgi:hypothetical protein
MNPAQLADTGAGRLQLLKRWEANKKDVELFEAEMCCNMIKAALKAAPKTKPKAAPRRLPQQTARSPYWHKQVSSPSMRDYLEQAGLIKRS